MYPSCKVIVPVFFNILVTLPLITLAKFSPPPEPFANSWCSKPNKRFPELALLWPCNVKFPAKSYTPSVELLLPTLYGFKLTKYSVPFPASEALVMS